MKRSLLLFLAITLITGSCSKQVQQAKSTNMKPNAPLENTRWKLMSLEGISQLPTIEKDVWIQFVLNSASFRGNAGCNNMTGTYKAEGSTLKIGPVAMTRMMCPEPNMKIEQGVARAVNEVDSYEIQGDRLLLKKGTLTLATFEALYLK